MSFRRRLRSPSLLVSPVLLALVVGVAAAHARADDADEPAGDAVRSSEGGRILLRVKKGEELAVGELLKDISIRRGQLVIADERVRAVKIRFLSNADVTWDMLRYVLESHEVRLVEKRMASGELVLRAVRRSELAEADLHPDRVLTPKPAEPGGDEGGLEGAGRAKRLGPVMPETQEIVTAIIPIEHGAGNDIFSNLRGLAQRDRDRTGTMLYVRGPEVIIVTDLARKVAYYQELVRALDVPAPGQVIEVRTVVHAQATELATTVQGLLAQGIVARPGVPQQVGASPSPRVAADARSNQLIIQALPHELPGIHDLIDRLDVDVPPRPPHFFSVPVQNAFAPDVASKLNELVNGAAATPRAGGADRQRRQVGGAGRPGGSNGGGRRGGRPAPAPSPRPAVGVVGGAGALASLNHDAVETRIVADEATNSLLIQAEEEVFAAILELIETLDRRPRQVGVEVQVWEVVVPNDDLQFAIELAGAEAGKDGGFGGAAATAFGASQLGFDPATGALQRVPGLGTGVIGVLGYDQFSEIPVILRALATKSQSRLLTQTTVVTNDNESATFSAGDTFPFLTQTFNNVVATQDVSEASAATTLNITPRIAGDDVLTLDLDVQVKSFTGGAVGGLPPPTNDRSYGGLVTIPNGHWVVFGGLEQETDTEAEEKVPFVGDIPLLGWLFKRFTRTHSRTKVYIFARPTILADPGFKNHVRASALVRDRMQRDGGWERAPEPLLPQEALEDPHGSVHDQIYEVLGTSSGNPFGTVERSGAGAPLDSRGARDR